MKLEPKPLCFAPVYKSYLWGGKNLPAQYRRADTPEVCAESWEISGHAEGMSIVNSGAFAGETLDALNRRFGAQLTGRATETFPLIFKLINARERLSVQVHPSDAAAAQWGGEAKSEMWHMLANGRLYAGLRDGVTEADFRAALADRSVDSLLVKHDVNEGDSLYIPGGLIHAIGEDCLVYEVQQCSNTTYRLFDWERNRKLHIDQGLRVVDWKLGVPGIVRGKSPALATGWRDVVRSPYFHMRGLALENEAVDVASAGDTFHALFVKRGNARVEAGGTELPIGDGASVLIPACCGAFKLVATGRAEILVTTL